VTQALRTAHGPKERAERALELLCEERGADAGHLCLAGESGLILAASRNLPPPDAALLERAAEYLHRQLNEAPEHTTAPTPEASAPPRAPALEDASGEPHLPVILRCVIDGAPLCAGIALIATGADASAQKPVPPELIAAVSASLIAAGNTRGMRTRAER
jgi:GAF domain-containing protein